jgi:hypothetical protein
MGSRFFRRPIFGTDIDHVLPFAGYRRSRRDAPETGLCDQRGAWGTAENSGRKVGWKEVINLYFLLKRVCPLPVNYE